MVRCKQLLGLAQVMRVRNIWVEGLAARVQGLGGRPHMCLPPLAPPPPRPACSPALLHWHHVLTNMGSLITNCY